MSKATFQVVKLGGSLLEFANWEAQFWRWLRASDCAQTIVVVGGGAEVDQLRDQQQARAQTDVDAHWEAIGIMGRNARQVAAKLLGTEAGNTFVVARLKQLDRALRNQPLVFVDPLKLLREDEPLVDGVRLPCSWEVTSDSIAARIAELVGCSSITLLKSALPRDARTYSQAAMAGYVDAFFPRAAAHLAQVGCANLQSAVIDRHVLVRD